MPTAKRSTFFLAETSKMGFPKTEFHGYYLPLDVHRNNWPMAKINCVCPNKDDAVRNVQVLVGLCNGIKAVLGRPIHKTVLLVEADEK